MKIISLFILTVIVVCACSQRNNNTSVADIEVIPVNLDSVTQDVSSFIEKIEIVPLETNDSSLIPGIDRVRYDKKTDIYALFTRDQEVFTFKGNGEYIANSKKMKGQGPEEYNFVLDICFNPYLGGIDMLNPYGTIYTYSPTFELLTKRKYTPEFPINRLMALDSASYIFTHPTIWMDQELSFVDINTQQVTMAKYEGTILNDVGVGGSDCFRSIGGHFYYVPNAINYYVYQIDPVEKKLIPVMYFDFGDKEVKEDGIPGRGTGKRVSNDNEREAVKAEIEERRKYIRASEYLLPKIRYISEDYIYVYSGKSMASLGKSFFYNRKTKESFLLADEEPFWMPPAWGLVDNILFLLTVPEPDHISKLIDRKLMSPEEISKMEALDEEDNPVIVKYYLKK